MFFLDGKMVGAAGPTSGPHQHPAWTTYIATADADATAKAVQDAGGQVFMEPMDVFDQGRMAVFSDSTGAHFSVWQPGQHKGAERVNEPGSFCWNELYTRDVAAAREFYQTVFGYEIEEMNMNGGTPYTIFKVDGRPIAGGMDMTAMLPDSIPPHWLVYFTVTDTAGSVDKAKELGATILAGPQPTPMGPMAVIQDPVGAAFAIIQTSAQS
jgi:predicted enzyme related to lactoylglutathione lyase